MGGRLSGISEEILVTVGERRHVRSLRALTAEMGCDYKWAWECLNVLEARGLLTVEREPGKPLVVTLPTLQG